MQNAPPPSCSTCGSWWRLPLLLGLFLAAIVWSRLHNRMEAPSSSDAHPGPAANTTFKKNEPQETVSLGVDFGGGRRKNLDPIEWHDGMTVADLLRATPGLTIGQKGSGQSAFLTGIDGVENRGAAGDNWTYTVNGKYSDRSFEVYKLQPGDRVLWTFGSRQ